MLGVRGEPGRGVRPKVTPRADRTFRRNRAHAVSLADVKGTLDIPPYVRLVEILVGQPLWHTTVRVYAQKTLPDPASTPLGEPRWDVWHETDKPFKGAKPATRERIADAIVKLLPSKIRLARPEEISTANEVERAIKVNGHMVGGIPAAMVMAFPSGLRHIALQLTTHVAKAKTACAEALRGFKEDDDSSDCSLEGMVCAGVVCEHVCETVGRVLRTEVSSLFDTV